jgi:hypothetical protein
MIDWFNVAANSLWILGCAMALATLSYASWQASIYKETLRARLDTPGVQRAFYLSGILFCAGLAGASDSTLEVILWAMLGFLFCLGLIQSIRQGEDKEEGASPQS